jgi:hypothetical protein
MQTPKAPTQHTCRQTLQLLGRLGLQRCPAHWDALSDLAGQQCNVVMLSQDVELLDDLDDEPDNVIRTRHGRPSKKAGKREGTDHVPVKVPLCINCAMLAL